MFDYPMDMDVCDHDGAATVMVESETFCLDCLDAYPWQSADYMATDWPQDTL